MQAGGALVVALAYVAIMAVMSRRAAKRLPREGDVPIHFDIHGEADGFGPRWVTLAMLPAILAALALIGLIPAFLGVPTRGPGGIVVGIAVVGAIFLAAHALIIGLLLRWAGRRY